MPVDSCDIITDMGWLNTDHHIVRTHFLINNRGLNNKLKKKKLFGWTTDNRAAYHLDILERWDQCTDKSLGHL